jgi:hypothetical protein
VLLRFGVGEIPEASMIWVAMIPAIIELWSSHMVIVITGVVLSGMGENSPRVKVIPKVSASV